MQKITFLRSNDFQMLSVKKTVLLKSHTNMMGNVISWKNSALNVEF